MPVTRLLPLVLLLAPLPALAQGPAQPVGVSDADALAEQVRRLGANPLDLEALLTAGEISIRLEDFSAAGAFFQRAERIDARNGRAKAGEGAILVHSERPAESLRFFAQAEQLGLAPARFAAERGLAYDLLGDPGRAQRDYRAALADRDDPEARRRYALSLGIAGRQAQALDELAPLIRANDRGAWRTRAFVLAMGGDSAGALRIAETMMPPGAATSLQQFFVELPRLPAIDRAFAVHFGEVRATPQRLADARLAPHEPPLPLAAQPVQVAAVVPPPVDTRHTKRDRHHRDQPPVTLALAAPPPPPLPPPPAYQAPVYVGPAATTPMRDRPLSAGEQATLAAAGVRPSSRRPGRGEQVPVMPAVARALTPAEQASLAAAGDSRTPEPVHAARPAPIYASPIRPLTPGEPTSLAAATGRPPEPVRIVPASPPPSRPLVSGSQTALASVTGRPSTPVRVLDTAPLRSEPRPAPPTVAAVTSSGATPLPPVEPPLLTHDLAATTQAPLPSPGFSAALTAPTTHEPVPGAEVAAVPVAASPAATPPQTAVVTPLAAAATASPSAPSVTPTAPAALVTPPRIAAAAPSPPHRAGRAEADSVLSRIVAGLTIPASELDVPAASAPTAGERRAAERRAAADRQAQADRRAAAAAQAEADREAAEERRAARAEPARIWVQVAGGANEAGLALSWRIMRDKAPDVLGSRQAWTTPLRATNRVLTGPFRTDAEARAVVNQLSHAGVNAFTFTSEAGQKVTRLQTR